MEPLLTADELALRAEVAALKPPAAEHLVLHLTHLP